MTLQEVLTALRNADAAGDAEAARRLARIAESMQQPSAMDRLRELQRRQREAQLAPRPEPEVETTIGGNIKEAFKGLVPGAIGLAETASTGIAALLPEDTEKAAREKIKEIAGVAKKPFEAARGYEDSIGRKLGEGLGSTLPFFALGPAGIAGRVAGAGLGVAAGAGEAREAAEAKGVTGSDRALATALGAPTGLLDILAPNIGPLKSIITTALARGGVEGATEAAQRVAQNLIAKGVYDPSQGVLTGAGEEGAYGAGVGAIASVILDLTLGRKARARMGGEGETTPPTPDAGKKEEPLLLGYDKKPFTPMVMPDGSVITSPSELDKYEQLKRERDLDRRTSDPLAGLPKDQRDLARSGKEAALAETFAGGKESPDGTVRPTEPGQLELFGRTERREDTAPEEPAPDLSLEGQLGLDLQGGMTIDDLINEMYAEDERKAAAKVQEEKAAEEKTRAKMGRLKMESDIAELDGRRQREQEKNTEGARLGLLLPIVESDVKNIPKAFVQTLKREGFTDLNLSERERRLIERVYDLRAAEPVALEEEPSAPAENQSMEALIPEKKEQREPQQMGLPGLGKPKGVKPQAFSPEELAQQAEQDEKPFNTVLTADVLDRTGLPRQSGFFRQLLDIDMADPAQQPKVAEVLTRVRANGNLSQSTKDAIEHIATQAFTGLAKQQSLFGPRGGVTNPEKSAGKSNAKKPEPKSESKPSDNASGGRRDNDAGNDNAAARTRTGGDKSGAKQAPAKPAADSERTEAPKSAGLGDRGKSSSDTAGGKSSKPGALNDGEKKAGGEKPSKDKEDKPKSEGKKPEGEKESKPKADPNANIYAATKAGGDPDLAVRNLAADGYLAFMGKTTPSLSKLTEMVANMKAGNFPSLRFGDEGVSGVGTGGKFAREFRDSLTDAEEAKFKAEFIRLVAAEIPARQLLDAMEARASIRQAIADEYKDLRYGKDTSALFKDARYMSRTLPSSVVDLLRGNKLVGALQYVGNMNLGRASEVANKIAAALRNVDVEIVDFKKPPAALRGLNLTGASGVYVGGKVYLDSNTGLDVWTLLHESMHPLVNATLENKSHPLTKQLQQLFDDVKGSLDTAYGATDLKEFVAEAWSNPDFQSKLAAINPKGERVTAWDKFVRSVKNFVRKMLGMETKPQGSALDAADVLIEAVINGHNGVVATLGSASMLMRGGAVLDSVGRYAEMLPGLDSERVDAIDGLLRGTLPKFAKNVIRQALPLNALTEVAAKDLPMAPELDVLVNERSGAESRRNQQIEPVVKTANEWKAKNPDLTKKFNNVVYTSTLYRVNPSKRRDTYLDRNGRSLTDDSGNKLAEIWDEMQADWNAIGADGRKVYMQIRDTYKSMYDEIKRVLDARIDASVSDPESRTRIKNGVYNRLFENAGSIDPYFPLTRSGEYWLAYNIGAEKYVRAFDTPRARDRAIAEVKAQRAENIQKFAQPDVKNYKNTPAASFVNDILRTLEVNRVDPTVTEEVTRLFLNTLPEISFAQSFRRRKGTLGFETDAFDALQSKVYNLSRQISNIEYGAKMEALRGKMKDHVAQNGNKEEAVAYLNELNARINYAISPRTPQWAQVATSFGFNMTLGLNVSAAIVNLAQVPLVVMPYLGGKYGFAESARAIGRATRYFKNSGFKRNVKMLVPYGTDRTSREMPAGPSLDNYDFTAEGAPKHLKTLAEVAGARGQLNRSQAYDVLDIDERPGLMNRINMVSGFMFHHGERMNRQVALIAAYELELQRLIGKDNEFSSATEEQRRKAAEYAVYVTELTNGGTSAAAAPRLAQNPLGKVIFMYKRYGVSMYYLLFKTANEAFFQKKPDGMSEEEFKAFKSAAKRQVAGIYGSAALLAGAQGLPLFGAVAMLYNLLFKGEDDDDFDTAARKYLGEGVYSGAVNALLGVDVASRIGLSDLLFRDTTTRPSTGVVASLMETMGGPVMGSLLRIERGLNTISEGHTMRGLEQMMPSAIANMMKGVRFATEGANTLRGDPIVGDITSANAFAQLFGFAPAEYTRQLEINSDLKSFDRTATERRTKLLRKYYVAMREGDVDGMADAMEEITKFNERYSSNAITPDTINRSMTQHMKTTQEMYHGITLSKNMRPMLLQMAAEYDGDDE